MARNSGARGWQPRRIERLQCAIRLSVSLLSHYKLKLNFNPNFKSVCSHRLVDPSMLNWTWWDKAQAVLQHTLRDAKARGLLKERAVCVDSLAMIA